jgi:hypothetical protein
VQEILTKLADGNNLQCNGGDILFQEFCDAICKWRESTTTSPSGRHLGHYKILLRLEVAGEKDNGVNVSIMILEVYHKILMTALTLGLGLTRWKNISTCMIEKKPGVTKIDKMHVIHLFEADYNLVLKILWARQAVWNAHQKRALNGG